MVEHRSEVAQHLRPPVGQHHNTVYEVGARQVQHLFWNFALIGQQTLGLSAEDLLDVFNHTASCWRATRGDTSGNLLAVFGFNILCAVDSEVKRDIKKRASFQV